MSGSLSHVPRVGQIYVIGTIITYSLIVSKGFGHIRDSGERPLNTLQTSERRTCGEKQTVAILSNQQTKVLLAPSFYFSGNFLQLGPVELVFNVDTSKGLGHAILGNFV